MATTILIIDLGRNHQQGLNLLGGSLRRVTGYSHGPGMSPRKIQIKYKKGERGTLSTLTQWSKVTSPGMGQADITCRVITCPGKGTAGLLWFCPKRTAQILTTGKHQESPNWGTFHEKTWPELFKNVSHKRPRKELFQNKRD